MLSPCEPANIEPHDLPGARDSWYLAFHRSSEVRRDKEAMMTKICHS
jgi:hypothetical protein